VNAGNANARLGRGSSAEGAYRRAAEMAEQAHVTDLGGLAALNLGVLCLRRGDHAEAREHFSRAYRLFTRVKNEPRRLAALYNQANLARELGDAGEALGLYESASQLADELGLPDLRVGALAGAGLSALSLGMEENANAHRRVLDEMLSDLSDSRFQGIEIVHGFLVQHDIARRDMDGALRRFRTVMADLASYDAYAFVWFVAECASALAVTGSSEIGDAIDRALQASREIQATLLARRLSAAYTAFHSSGVSSAEAADQN
jgi:tetratricopeptide (TPR) repeat protein